MLTKKQCIAMLLAGGQGSRLYALTNKIANVKAFIKLDLPEAFAP